MDTSLTSRKLLMFTRFSGFMEHQPQSWKEFQWKTTCKETFGAWNINPGQICVPKMVLVMVSFWSVYSNFMEHESISFNVVDQRLSITCHHWPNFGGVDHGRICRLRSVTPNWLCLQVLFPVRQRVVKSSGPCCQLLHWVENGVLRLGAPWCWVYFIFIKPIKLRSTYFTVRVFTGATRLLTPPKVQIGQSQYRHVKVVTGVPHPQEAQGFFKTYNRPTPSLLGECEPGAG